MQTHTGFAAPTTDVRAVPGATSAIFVVGNDAHTRKSLHLLLTAERFGVEAFASAADFLSRPPSAVPCCLVLDVGLPGPGGLELQRRLAGRTEMPIIFTARRGDVATTVEAMKAGAFDFLLKPLEADVLLEAIRSALERSREALLHESQMQMLRIGSSGRDSGPLFVRVQFLDREVGRI